ncbi:MAG: hypothetical protein M3Y87_35955, partial [Myxococcota bacterium]|nr:hypothetical protein [Myxococcota bacterium]
LRARAAAQKADAAHLEGIVVGNLAVVRMRRGAHAEAYEELQLGLRRAERLGQRQLEGALHTFSLVGAAHAERWDRWDLHEREASRALGALETSEEDIAWAAQRAAELAHERGDLARARSAFTVAAAHWSKLGRALDASLCVERARTIE